MPLLTALRPETLTPETPCVFTSGFRYGDGGWCAALYLGYVQKTYQRKGMYLLKALYGLSVNLETGFVRDYLHVSEEEYQRHYHRPFVIRPTALGVRVVGAHDVSDRYSMSSFLKMGVPYTLDHMRGLPPWEE